MVEGYVQAVDYDELIAAAEQEDLLLCLQYRPGDFVIAGSRLLRVQPADRTGPAVVARFNRAFICGRYATPEQDVEHAIRQIAEVAVRALSPGVNDPFTAMNCVDVLCGALCRIARSGLPGPLRYGCEGRLRLITRVTTFPGLTDASFNLIRQSAAGNVAVSIRLLETLAACIGQMDADEHRKSLLRHAGMVWRQAQATVSETEDLADLRRRFELAQAAAPARTP